ncbi:hemin ABC transporter substrate-binding protein [Methyloversatilis sp.]|uniref:heme/hemin ABC transporter substrate-binding protein n=1 Tax=Methyloversatilis sp. TaxID=2569862 RepID=UPI002733E740|nr:ABC transporter substrate-binding protein [Methyloversatilis sp.]MDP2869233.1 ABC transporter substrate-binding protein [Methyloversatilis sp.]MDP3289299.1 ABC transporter substrate-binding protein [Methyloversatilis sp.]MDP3454977.1 ABC transporter substrate-binding protein [Methyloversatilis sp.]MDP3576883.1 ABC transporter substrate-binding protein [Methyloversatilis sp.]
MKRLALLSVVAALCGPALADSAQRLVTVGGAVTEIVYALGAGARVVATDTTSTFPAAAQALPRVGYQRALAAEGVLSMRPTLLIATADAGPPVALTQLQGAGVRVLQLDAGHRADQVGRTIRAIAASLALDDAGRTLAERFDADWAAARQRVAALPGRPRALFILDHGGASPMVAGDGTAAAAMIDYAGAVNVMAGRFNGYRPLTLEAALAAAPDLIVTTDEAIATAGGRNAFLARPGLAALPAARAGRLVTLDALRLLGFGPRLPAAVLDLAQRMRTP